MIGSIDHIKCILVKSLQLKLAHGTFSTCCLSILTPDFALVYCLSYKSHFGADRTSATGGAREILRAWIEEHDTRYLQPR